MCILQGVKVPVIDVDEPVEPPRSAPLEGTTEDPVTTLAQEIFLFVSCISRTN